MKPKISENINLSDSKQEREQCQGTREEEEGWWLLVDNEKEKRRQEKNKERKRVKGHTSSIGQVRRCNSDGVR